MSARHFLAPLLAVALSSCAGVLGIEEAELIEQDATVPDSANPSPEAGSACEQYCSCMGLNCPGSFADAAACLKACATYTDQLVSCRTDHCGAAAHNPLLECPHALDPCK